MTVRDSIRAALIDAARGMGVSDPVDPVLERPRDPAHGEWATNLAMTLARVVKRKPSDIAQELTRRLDLASAGVERVEIAGPGFINFHVTAGSSARGLAAIVARGDQFGRSAAGAGKRVNVEFVSANPTGPLHVGHGRQAALGDAVAALLEWTGWRVSREYYYNDAGVQIANLGRSVQARIAQADGRDVPIPEGGYHGEYVREIAQHYVQRHPGDHRGADFDIITRFAVQEMRSEQDRDLQAFGVRFDTYYLESSLYADGKVEETVRALVAAGHTFEQDNALWLRTTEFGDDKDRVMRKRDGTYTYFLPDVAYHVTKWKRGYTRAINVQGADHHSTVTRVRAGLQALDMGIPAGYPEYVLHQMVTVMRGGEEVKLSKRAGEYVTVRDLVDDVGRDAVRYFFLMRKIDSQLVFDVDLARSQSEENPVYYIQMAHARLCGIFRVGEIAPESITTDGVDFDALAEPEEQELVKTLVDFPAFVAGAAETLEPHRIASYLLDAARQTHLWYHKHHVLNEPARLMSARLLLARAAQIVLRNGLAILGITAPARM
ncbi:MAG TPA: arginine--tRNA ligase [Gemmatimonadaceae bacterium]|jgi:arginyl-tRNA synthetase|nr:arginine--tRNA ligase [Gemmatimonadaceae bacterium]